MGKKRKIEMAREKLESVLSEAITFAFQEKGQTAEAPEDDVDDLRRNFEGKTLLLRTNKNGVSTELLSLTVKGPCFAIIQKSYLGSKLVEEAIILPEGAAADFAQTILRAIKEGSDV